MSLGPHQAWINGHLVRCNNSNELSETISATLRKERQITICYHKRQCTHAPCSPADPTIEEKRILRGKVKRLANLGFKLRTKYRNKGPDALLEDSSGSIVPCEVKCHISWGKYLQGAEYLVLVDWEGIYKVQKLL